MNYFSGITMSCEENILVEFIKHLKSLKINLLMTKMILKLEIIVILQVNTEVLRIAYVIQGIV